MPATFKTDFPGGSGLLLDLDESSDPVRVRFAAEPRNCPRAMWFHFRLTGLAARALEVTLANPDQTLGGDWSGNKPVYRHGEDAWQRATRTEVLRSPTGTAAARFRILPGPGDAVDVAFCYPYQEADLRATLQDCRGAWQLEFVGLSAKGRPLMRLFNHPGDADRSLPGVYVITRGHAGETPGSWVLDGLLRHLAADAEKSRRLVVWAVPFVNIDDVAEGSYGKDPWPWDLNRAWGRPPRRPEVTALQADTEHWAQRCRPTWFLDLHAPGHAERVSHVYVPDRPERPWIEAAKAFADRFQQALPEAIRPSIAWRPAKGLMSVYEGKKAVEWAYEQFACPGCVYEVSYQGTETTDYTIEDYRRMGGVLADVLFDWCTSR